VAIGRRVREHRVALGFSQRELAERASLSVSYLSRLERGCYADPSATYLSKLAATLGCGVGDLLGEAADHQRDSDDRELDQVFATAMAELMPEEKRTLKEYIRLLLRLSRERRGQRSLSLPRRVDHPTIPTPCAAAARRCNSRITR
jgi:transcriptional regulator with XRE-family HTH domain